MKLGIGTVQFGPDSDVSNSQGKVPPDEVINILTMTENYGIGTCDTASHYISSEKVLDQFIEPER